MPEANEDPKDSHSSELHSTNEAKTPASALLEFLFVITRWRRFIAYFVLLSIIGAGLYALLAPKWYMGEASVMPAEQSLVLSGLEGASSLLSAGTFGRALSGFAGPSESDKYIAILGSDRVLLSVIKKFDLTNVYHIKSYPVSETIKELKSNTEFVVGDHGELDVEVYDKVPARAADMANYFIEQLNEVNSELHVQSATAVRDFIEQRYNKNLADLRNTEDSLRSFEQRNGVVAIPEQLQSSIQAVASLEVALEKSEVELEVFKKQYSETDPQVMSKALEVEGLRQKVSDLVSRGEATGEDHGVFIPLSLAPALGLEYLRLYRNVQIQDKILQFLTPVYEQAKVEEKRETPTVVVLDHALVPERKSKPKVTLYVLIAFVLSLLLALLITFTVEGFRKLRSEKPEKVDFVVEGMLKDWFGLKWRRRRP